jgi:hypothetical protein
VAPGDTVYLRGGTYSNESHSVDFVNKTGTALAKYTFRAYLDEIPILDGPGSGTWAISNCDYVEYYGIRWRDRAVAVYIGETSYPNAGCTNILFDGCHFYDCTQEIVRIAENSSYITLRNCTIHDSPLNDDNTEGVYLGTADPGDNTHHVYVLNCTIYNTGTEGIDLK